MVVNLEGIKPGELVIDGQTIANIYLDKIKYWDDEALKKLNPGVKFPHEAIACVHRSDGSGTTFVFTNYLSKVSNEWKTEVGEGTSVSWPIGIGGKGNEGVAGAVKETYASIGYVEYAYAVQSKLKYMKMINSAHKTLEPGIGVFQAAAANADWENAPGFYQILTDQPGDQSWPITGASFILVHKQPDDPAALLEALKFFDWAFDNGQKMAEDLSYIPLPDNLVQQIERSWSDNIKTVDGKSVWTK
jgi:phosphate transport system substrate-binding protein